MFSNGNDGSTDLLLAKQWHEWYCEWMIDKVHQGGHGFVEVAPQRAWHLAMGAAVVQHRGSTSTNATSYRCSKLPSQCLSEQPGVKGCSHLDVT